MVCDASPFHGEVTAVHVEDLQSDANTLLCDALGAEDSRASIEDGESPADSIEIRVRLRADRLGIGQELVEPFTGRFR